MIHQSVFYEIAALLSLAALGGVVGLALRQPLIVSFLVVGILAGPDALGILQGRRAVHAPGRAGSSGDTSLNSSVSLPRLLPDQLAERPFGSPGVAPAPDQAVRHEAVLVDRPPQPVLPAGDGDRHLIRMSAIAPLRRPPAHGVGDLAAERAARLAHGLVADDDAAGRRHLLDQAQAGRDA